MGIEPTSFFSRAPQRSLRSLLCPRATLAPISAPFALTRRASRRVEQTLEREMGIEPTTNSLEGCDSTTELLPLAPAVTLVRA